MSESIAKFVPKTLKLELSDGAHISVVPISLGHLAIAEEEFGTQEDFLAALQGESKKVSKTMGMIKALWILIENKADFGNDPLAMAKFINAETGKKLAAMATGMVASSMPDKKPAAQGSAAAGKRKPKEKPTGENSSPSSADTTASA